MVLGIKFTQSLSLSISAKVDLTSPGCIGFIFFIALTPNEASNNFIKSKRLVGLLLPTLKILCGAKEVEGSGFFSSKLRFEYGVFKQHL